MFGKESERDTIPKPDMTQCRRQWHMEKASAVQQRSSAIWRSLVLAADAKKAGPASILTFLTPSALEIF